MVKVCLCLPRLLVFLALLKKKSANTYANSLGVLQFLSEVLAKNWFWESQYPKPKTSDVTWTSVIKLGELKDSETTSLPCLITVKGKLYMKSTTSAVDSRWSRSNKMRKAQWGWIFLVIVYICV